MTKYEFSDRKELWNLTPKTPYEIAPKFGRMTGMARNRFESLMKHIRFGIQPTSNVPDHLSHAQHRWLLVDKFVENFNKHRADTFVPSHLICVDESISRWYGQGGAWINKGLPMYIAINRKPENGCEIQNAACGVSGVMLRLTIVKGVTKGHDEEHDGLERETLNHGTRIFLDLVRPWTNTMRIVCADSYFASVHTAEELLKCRL